jgi:hypothetical protein
VAKISDAFGFDAMMDAILEANKRAEASTIRRLHRRIPGG